MFLTNGSLQGFVFLAQQLAPGKRVLAELPTYDRPLKILRELGSDVELLACDDEGLDPDALEQALRDGPAPAFLYLIPTFQNPSGRTLSLERRRRIVELAQEHDLLVLEDDPYGLVRYEGEALPSLFELSGGKVAYSSSFSKTIGPGLRVGWFVFPEALALRDRGCSDRDLHHAGAARPGDGERVRAARQLRAEPRARPRAARRPQRCDARGARPRSARGAARRGRRAATSSGSSSAASMRLTCSCAPRRPV